MDARVKKWGDDFAIPIPQTLANRLNLRLDSPVNVTINGRELIISPIGQAPESLEQLLEKVTEDNRHEEIDSGPPVGKEIW